MTLPADLRGWGWPGTPGTPTAERFKRENIVKVSVAGVDLWVNKLVAPLFKWFIEELTSGGYRLNVRADDWGYANRDVRGRPGVKSNHSWGLAVDLNATTNPMTNDGRNHSDLPKNVSALAAKYGLRWGGDYTGSRKDPMHFEFIGTPKDAQERIRRLSNARSAPDETSKEFFAMDQATFESILKRVVGAEVDKRVVLILRGSETHPDNLKTIHEEVAAIRTMVDELRASQV